MRARAEVNLAGHAAGEIAEVDADDPDVKARLASGVLSPVDPPGQRFCIACHPPSFFDTEADLIEHTRLEHEGVGRGGSNR